MPGNPRKVGLSLGNQSNKIGVLLRSFRNDYLRYEPIEAEQQYVRPWGLILKTGRYF
jgi:hypothetical protein